MFWRRRRDKVLRDLAREVSYEVAAERAAEERDRANERADEAMKMMKAERESRLIRVRFDADDVRALAEEAKVPFRTALERAEEWSSSIEDRLVELGNEQLMGAIRDGQP